MRILAISVFCGTVLGAFPVHAQTWDEVMAEAGDETKRLVMCSAVLTATGSTMAEAGLSAEDAAARTTAGGVLSFGAGVTRMGTFGESMDDGIATAERHAGRLTELLGEMFPAGADATPITEQIAPCMAEAEAMDAVLKEALGE
jgi:hypothetical protein